MREIQNGLKNLRMSTALNYIITNNKKKKIKITK